MQTYKVEKMYYMIVLMNHNNIIFSVPYPFEDRVFHKTELQSQKVEAFCNKMKVMKANLKKVCNGYHTEV